MIKKTLVSAITGWLLLATLPTAVSAQISVNRSVIEFSPSDKVQDIEVFNGGDNKAYLDMSAVEIINPELADAQRVALSDPRTAPLLITPRQLLVPPGERRRLRVILREPAVDKDRIFRLSVKPYVGSVNIENTGDNEKASAIKVLVGYDLLLISRPATTQADVLVERLADRIDFHNTGNTNVLLRKIEQCDKDGKECVELQPNRLYAGERYSVELPLRGDAQTNPVTVWQAVGLENTKLVY